MKGMKGEAVEQLILGLAPFNHEGVSPRLKLSNHRVPHRYGSGIRVTGGGGEPGKAQLQRQMEAARESISQTVEEIKDTVEDQYESVKETVSGVLDYREQFQKDPIVWSVGALSAGFALGYTFGYAHKNMKPAGRKRSEVAAFADSLVDELSTVGQSLVMPSLNAKMKQLFGFDFSDMLEEIGGAKKTRGKKKASRKSGATSQGARRRAKVPTAL